VVTISVIIPAYNAERTILETIESVQQQTFSDFELIVINDGSIDRTLELLQNIKDQRLKVFSYENGGLPVARNRGMSQATGEFITFIDADDLWTPDKLELQLAALQQHPTAGVAYSWTYFMHEKTNTILPSDQLFFEGNIQRKLLIRNFLDNGSNPLICREAIASVGEFEPSCGGYADWDYWLRLAACWNFVLVPKHQIFYRISSGSMSTKVQAMEDAGLLVVERAFRAAPLELHHLQHQSLAMVYWYSAHLYMHHNGNSIDGVNQAGRKLCMSIQVFPAILLEKHIQDLGKWFIRRWIKVCVFKLLNVQVT